MTEAIERLAIALADRYHIERELGAGGMATVYLAEDLKHDRKVALKVLKPELAAVLGADRFVVEIKTTASLQHPHILPLFDSGSADGFLFYVMPFIAGETLRDKLNRETQLGIEDAVRITTDVADALDYAHRHGVIHRDIKPENILLHDGRPMVADFGIALAVSAAAGGRMTETGLSLGTPHYMSPEQATAEKDLTGRSDIYSLAAVLYEMLTGNPPHVGASVQQIIMKIVTEDVDPVTTLRRSVPPNVAAAVAKALAKLPADRFETAAAFAEALGNPAFTTATAADSSGSRARAHASPVVRVLAALAIPALLVAGWALLRPQPTAGPSVYDVALPDTAPMRVGGVGFAVAPAGDFAIYTAQRAGHSELWYRSLHDATARRIDGTEGARSPSVSPDGVQVAYLRVAKAQVATLEVMPVAGGTATTLGTTDPYAQVEWLADGRVRLVEGDGNNARWFDPSGGTSTGTPIQYCMMVASLPDPDALLCGGGGAKNAYQIDIKDSSRLRRDWHRVADSAPVFGAQFRVIDGRYLIYLSSVGDLLAAPVNLATGQVGRSVRMLAGLGREYYTGAGTFAVGASGTLVYASGANRAVGQLVRVGEHSMDTLPVGRAAFLLYAMSPDQRRLAAVVEVLDGEELRVYDLRSGDHVTWLHRPQIRQPLWSPTGDRLTFQSMDTIFVGALNAVGVVTPLFVRSGFEGFSWLRDGRVVGIDWDADLVLAAHMDKDPVTLDTIVGDAGFVRPSPDGRWLAYNDRQLRTLWLEPFPRTGERYQVAAGDVMDPQWLSPTEFVVEVLDSTVWFDRVRIDPATDPPIVSRRRFVDAPRFVDAAGESYALTPDGRVVYVEGDEERPIPYLRVVPHWVEQMKRAVDEANR